MGRVSDRDRIAEVISWPQSRRLPGGAHRQVKPFEYVEIGLLIELTMVIVIINPLLLR